MLIGVPRETAPGETRVAVTPETAKKLKAQGSTVRVESGAGVAATRVSPAAVSRGTPINMFLSPHPSRDGASLQEEKGQAEPRCRP